MNRMMLPVAAICLAAFGIGLAAPPAQASAEGRRNTAILLGLAAAIAADEYAEKRAEEACRSRCGHYYEYERYEPRCRPSRAPKWRHEGRRPGHPRHADIVVRVERHEHYYYDLPCRERPRVEARPCDDGPAYWREPWAR